MQLRGARQDIEQGVQPEAGSAADDRLALEQLGRDITTHLRCRRGSSCSSQRHW